MALIGGTDVSSTEDFKMYDLPIGMDHMRRVNCYRYNPVCPTFDRWCCSCKGKDYEVSSVEHNVTNDRCDVSGDQHNVSDVMESVTVVIGEGGFKEKNSSNIQSENINDANNRDMIFPILEIPNKSQKNI